MVKRSREDFDTPSTNEIQDSRETTIEPPSSSPRSDPDFIAAESSKLFHIDNEASEASQQPEIMRCSLPPHSRQTISFTSFEDYEVHYNKMHVNRCAECRKNFPTPHFLDLHISENHNPLLEVLRERGEHTYACFVEDCDRKCSTPQKRRMHLIDKHTFPKDYEFYVVDNGIDQRTSMLRSGRHRRRSSAAKHKTDIDDRARRRISLSKKVTGDTLTDENLKTTNNIRDSEVGAMEVGGVDTSASLQVDGEMDGLVGAMSSLKFVPTSVRFGRGRGKGGFSRS